jgi:TRAP-type C4-dicarboxylate transport system substrate-binding protein
MKERVLPILTVLLLLALPAFAATFKMDLHASYSADSIHTQGAIQFSDLVRSYSNGTVEITVHPGGSLGFKDPELLKVVKDGQVPMADILMGVVAGSEHVFGVSSLPRLVPDFAAARKLYKDCRPLYEQAASRWNQKLLYAAPWPPSGLVTRKTVASRSDLANLKTRTYDKNSTEFLRILGVAPVSLPWGDVRSALNTGMINSVLTSAESTRNSNLWEFLGTFKPINYAFPLNMLTINLDSWKSLDNVQRDALLKAAAEVESVQWAGSRQLHLYSLKMIKENGIIISDVSAEFVAALDQAAAQMIGEYQEEASKEVQAVLKKYIQ